jgi:GNAT superfamily N-acetyltransferase
MEQSAVDNNCEAKDFTSSHNIAVISKKNPKARVYYELPLFLNLISYGNNIVISGNEKILPFAKEYADKYGGAHCFATPNLHVLNDKLMEHSMKVCFMAEYFLPDMNVLAPLKCGYEIKILKPKDFADLYTDEWGNALSEKRKEYDVIAAGAYDGEKLIGLAGASADCDTMWQIGVDVLPEYRKKGVAAALTSRLACEIVKLGKVPFYCCAWSNIGSARNAIKSGFRPAWVEMTAKSLEIVKEMNS